MSTLKIPNNIFEQMVAQAEKTVPAEACGYLAGRNGVTEKLYEMTNADNSPRHFTMVPEEQFAAAKKMRAEALEMLAVYHSHPTTPARPSQEDIKLAVMPGATYVILSLAQEKPCAKAFKIEQGAVTEVPVTII